MSVRTEQPDAVERAWWSRLPRLLYAPAEVFAELRDESREASDARQEPIVALTFLAGIAMLVGLVAIQPPYNRFYESLSAFNMTFEAILGGALVALSNFWVGGALFYLGARGLGAMTGYRLARHIAGLATAPFVLVLVFAVPARVGLYGVDLFRDTGRDSGRRRRRLHRHRRGRARLDAGPRADRDPGDAALDVGESRSCARDRRAVRDPARDAHVRRRALVDHQILKL